MYFHIDNIFQGQELCTNFIALKLKVCISVERIGVNFGAALRDQLIDLYGNQIEVVAADAAEFPGIALHALHSGFKEVLFAGTSIALVNLEKEAGILEAKIIPYDIRARNSLIKD